MQTKHPLCAWHIPGCLGYIMMKLENKLKRKSLSPSNCLATVQKHFFFFFLIIFLGVLGFPGGSVVKNLPANSRRCRRYGFDPWVRKIPWRRIAWQPTPVFLPGNPMDRGAWRATVRSVEKSWTWLSMHTHVHNWSIVDLQCCVSFC